MVVDNPSVPTDAEMDQAGGFLMRVLEGVGFAQATIEHGHPLKIGSIFGQFDEHARMMSKYIGLTIPIRNILNAINVNGGQLKKTLTAYLGTKYVKRLKRLLRAVAGLEGYERNGTQAIFNFLTGNVSKAKISWNPGSFFANRVGGSILYMSELAHISPVVAMDYMATFWIPASKILSGENRRISEYLMENGYLWDRWMQDLGRVYIPVAYDRLGKTPQSMMRMALRLIQQKALSPMKHAEMSNAINAFKALRRHGRSDAEARDIIESITRSSQNSSSALEDSDFIMDVRASGLGGIFPFMSQVVAARNMAVRDWLNKDWSKLFITLLGLALSIISIEVFHGLRRALRDRNKDQSDKQKERQQIREIANYAVEGMTQAIPGSQVVTEPLSAAIAGWQGNSGALLVEQPINDTRRGLVALGKFASGGKPVKPSTMIRMINGIGELMGLPMEGPTEAARAVIPDEKPLSRSLY